VAVLADLLERRALAEARDVRVLARVLFAAPGVVGAGDVLVGELAVGARPSLRASMKSTSPRRSRKRWFFLSRARNQRQAGICVE